MGVAILSGVIASMESQSSESYFSRGPNWETHTPGTMTPALNGDPTVPTRFLATVNREESTKKLRRHFSSLGALGSGVEISAGKNVDAVQQSDIVILA